MAATIVTAGRAGMALALLEQDLHLAWGTGDPLWDDGGAKPVLPDMTSLVNEIGRRTPIIKGFVEPSDTGDIVIAVGARPDGTVEEKRYQRVEYPTPYLYLRINYDFADAHNSIIRELAVFSRTQMVEGLPAGQDYFEPADIADNGLMFAVEILEPAISRSPSIRQSFDFVFPI